LISSLRGKLIHKNNSEIILDVGGVGYQIFISKSVGEKINEMNAEYSVITYLDVKESSLQLFGFISEKEKEVFKLLISVSGIGPKLAHTILTHLTFEEIIGVISDSSVLSRIKIPGIGIKKLELISMTLKDKVYKIDSETDYRTSESPYVQSGEFTRLDALNALMNLGYQRNDSEKLIREVLKQNGDKKLSTEEIIRKSLEYISK
jgi:Holliday junction DNA helicase RuvA